MNERAILGLDVGGANVKAAHSNGAALTRPFALWKYPDQLTTKLRDIRRQMPEHDLIALTMTGELCDFFEYKRAGVLAILQAVEEAAQGVPLRVWTTGARFVAPSQVRANPLSAAAANWLALAHFAGRFTGDAPTLLIDTGSTTTDIVFLEAGVPQPRGHADPQRMACGELVYTGIRRTPVCAVLGMGVAAEFFATMLDAYIVLGLVPEDAADAETADGRPATRRHASARLARMICADRDDLPAAELSALAARAVETQVQHVNKAVDLVLAGRPRPRSVVLCGSGAALGGLVIAAHPDLTGIRVVSLNELLGPALSEAGCAYAVAMLVERGEP